MANAVNDEPSGLWLFGYGSLIWKPPPHYDKRVPGWVTGYVRRFWQRARCLPCMLSSGGKHGACAYISRQASEDHRGTPEAPGRVVTLIERPYWERLTDHHDSAPDSVWGVAYHFAPQRVLEVKAYLDLREINGYTVHHAPFHPADGSPPITTLIYIGTPENEQFVGPQEPQELAQHISVSRGPSGANKDYLFSLHSALNDLSPLSGDAHVSDLAARVEALERCEQSPAATAALPSPLDGSG